jgi:hypothetical protein
MKSADIDKKIIEHFKISDFNTLRNSSLKRRYNLAVGINDHLKRSKIACAEACEMMGKYLSNSVYIRLILWNKNNEQDLNIQVLNKVDKFRCDCSIIDNGVVGYYHINNFDISQINELVQAHINFELGLEPSINATIYYIDFEAKVLINLYDDRGLDIISLNPL